MFIIFGPRKTKKQKNIFFFNEFTLFSPAFAVIINPNKMINLFIFLRNTVSHCKSLTVNNKMRFSTDNFNGTFEIHTIEIVLLFVRTNSENVLMMLMWHDKMK